MGASFIEAGLLLSSFIVNIAGRSYEFIGIGDGDDDDQKPCEFIGLGDDDAQKAAAAPAPRRPGGFPRSRRGTSASGGGAQMVPWGRALPATPGEPGEEAAADTEMEASAGGAWSDIGVS